MAKFKVYSTEVIKYEAEIEADSLEEATNIADTCQNVKWKMVNYKMEIDKNHEGKSNFFVIENVFDSKMVWSNTEGWVDENDCNYDVFTLEESETLDLPVEGKWVRI